MNNEDENLHFFFENLTDNNLISYRKYDTEDEWTYWRSDEELKGDIGFFIRRNKFFKEKFKEYNIETYDVSNNRIEVLNSIVENLVNE